MYIHPAPAVITATSAKTATLRHDACRHEAHGETLRPVRCRGNRRGGFVQRRQRCVHGHESEAGASGPRVRPRQPYHNPY